MDPISFGQIWPRTVASVRRHGDMLWSLAAAFLFLPQLLFARQMNDRPPEQWFKGELAIGDGVAVALVVLCSILSQIMMARLLVRDGTGGQPLGQDLKAAFRLFPAALAVLMLQGLATGFGLFLLILPGLWIFTRLSLAMPLVATDQPDPINALKTSWALTSGRTFKVFGMIFVIILGFMLLSVGIMGIGAALGVISTIAAGTPAEGWGVGRWLFELLNAGASAAFGTFYVAFITTLMMALKKHPADHF
ncbi:MAG: hypothetical protein DI568_03145 [Sphingomonas sp.]|nr:MAG: hypothetical protein DI568_03145 [Sphingomonas sp.]